LWRIVRINGDGTVKLVLNDIVEEQANFNTEIENHTDILNNTIYTSLNNYYISNLKDYDEYIINTKFCNDSTASNDTYYDAYARIITNNIPSFNCLGEKYSAKIGLLTVDEIIYAGATMSAENQKYYLYNDNIKSLWWTLTLAKTADNDFYPFSVTEKGKISYETSGTLYRGLRPTINIIKKATVSGKGTIDNPYIINTDVK